MPELPEVETSCQGIAPYIEGHCIESVSIRTPALRWPIPPTLANSLIGLKIERVSRRGKYLLLASSSGTLLIHLGMSGSLRILPSNTPVNKHDHADFIFDHGSTLRFNDPRRFGAILWTTSPIDEHPLLKNLGPEPLLDGFNADYLYHISRRRRIAVKLLIMNSHIVVGVGNIYANEALFDAGILPLRPSNSLSYQDCERLVNTIRQVLSNAIRRGGTTLRDFVNESGKPGYFQQELRVYGRGGKSCLICQQALQEVRLSDRATIFCVQCQS